MRQLSYSELAFKIIQKFVKDDEIPSADLRNIIVKSFASFRSTGEERQLLIIVLFST
jgi:threonine synthase